MTLVRTLLWTALLGAAAFGQETRPDAASGPIRLQDFWGKIPCSEFEAVTRREIERCDAANDRERAAWARLSLVDALDGMLRPTEIPSVLERCRRDLEGIDRGIARAQLEYVESRRALFDGDIDATLFHLERMSRASVDFPSDRFKKSEVLTRAIVAGAVGRPDEAEELIDEAWRIAHGMSPGIERTMDLIEVAVAAESALAAPDLDFDAVEKLAAEVGAAESALRRARALSFLGQMARKRMKLVKSLEYFDQARDLLRSIEMHSLEVVAEQSAADALSQLGREYDAVARLERALAMQEKGDFENFIALSKARLGPAVAAIGRFDRALTLAESAYETADRLKDVELRAIAGESLVDIRLKLGQADLAAARAEKTAADFIALGQPLGVVRIRMKIAECLLADSRAAEALPILNAVRSGLDANADPRSVADVSLLEAEAMIRLGKIENAMDAVENALAAFARAGSPGGTARARLWAAKSALASRHTSDAIADARAAHETFTKFGLAPFAAAARAIEAEALLLGGDAKAALPSALDALAGDLGSNEGLASVDLLAREDTARKASSTAILAALTLAEKGDPSDENIVEAAFRAVEGCRARLLGATIGNRAAVITREAGLSDLEDNRRCRDLVFAAREAAQSTGSADALAKLAAAEAALVESSSRLWRAKSTIREFIETPLASAATTRAHLVDDEAYVAWQVAGDRMIAVVVGKNASRVFDLGVAAPILADIEIYRRFVATAGSDDTVVARRLHAALVQPLLSLIDRSSRWIVSPDTAIALVPFEALVTSPIDVKPPRRLLEEREIAYVPSASIFSVLRRDKDGRQKGRGVLSVGDPDYERIGEDRRLPRLLKSRAEATSIVGLSHDPGRDRLLLGKDASVANFLEAGLTDGSRRRVIHLACHGIIDARTPSASGLLLADGEKLIADDLFGIRLPTDLVCLSACTSAGSGNAGEGIAGLARGFFAAGASGVVVSTFRVADGPTYELMQDFMTRFVKEREAAGLALRRAKLAMLARGGPAAHPSRWAAFLLWGERR